MGEIKSTLDLVMERTKNLRFSGDEKERHETDELKKSFNGLVQKFLDGLMDLASLKSETERLQGGQDASKKKALLEVILEKIDPETTGGPLLSLLQGLFQCEVDGLHRLDRDFEQEKADMTARRVRQLRAELKAGLGLSGSAVVPHPEADPQWRRELANLGATYTERLAAEKERLKSRC